MSKYYSAEFEDIKNCIIGPCWYMMEITDIIKIKFLTIYKFIFIDQSTISRNQASTVYFSMHQEQGLH